MTESMNIIHRNTPARQDLATLEKTIEKGLTTWVEVGDALCAIRDRQLWRDAGYEDFESYIRGRWEFSARRARQLMQASEAIAQIEDQRNHGSKNGSGDSGTQIEPNERQIREVAKAPEGERAEVWQEAVSTAPKDADGKPKVTASHVAKVVAKRAGGPPPAGEQPSVPVDEEGHPLPDRPSLRQAFAEAAAIDSLMFHISLAKTRFNEIRKETTCAVDQQEFERAVNAARHALKYGRPHSVCPGCCCTGKSASGKPCSRCHDKGWISLWQFSFNTTEDKAVLLKLKGDSHASR